MNKHTIFLAVAVVVGLPAPASAYVRTRTSSGAPMAWKNPQVLMEFAIGAVPPHMDATAYLDAAQQGAAAWSEASLDGANRCSNMLLSVQPTPDLTGPIGNDGHNRIVFRQTEWCRDPPPTKANEPPCYDRSALAITTVFSVPKSGEMLDADIELNAVNFNWGDYVGQPELWSSGTHDFQGTITHELGHVIGLEHTCYLPGFYSNGTPMPRPADNTGTPVPNCGPDNPPLIADATMYVSVSSPETEVGLRTLARDDVQGVCDITAPHKGGGCSLGAYQGHGFVAMVPALAALALRLRRKRSRKR